MKTYEEITEDYINMVGEDNWDPIEFTAWMDETYEPPVKKEK